MDSRALRDESDDSDPLFPRRAPRRLRPPSTDSKDRTANTINSDSHVEVDKRGERAAKSTPLELEEPLMPPLSPPPLPHLSSSQQETSLVPSGSLIAEPSMDATSRTELLEHYLNTLDEIKNDGVFGQRAVYQDAHAELRALEAKRATKFSERYEVVQTWPDWRQRLHRIVKRERWFEAMIFFIIMVNCATIMTDNIASIQSSSYSNAIKIIDDIIVWLYFVEMIIKMLALGVFVRRWGYFHSKWNVIDCAISVIGAVTFLVVVSMSDKYASAAKAVARALRVLRPFRVLTALGIFRTVLRSIANALVRLTHVLALSIVFTIVMGLIALHFFHGTISYRCHDVLFDPFTNRSVFSMPDEAPACTGSFLPSGFELEALGVPVPNPYDLPWGPTCVGGEANWSSAMTNSSSAGRAAVEYDEHNSNCTLQGSFPFLTSGDFHTNESAVAGYYSQRYISLPTDRPYHVLLNREEMPSERNGVFCPYSQLCIKGDNPSNNQDNFDDVLSAFLLLYTILCLEAWSSTMYYLVDARGLAVEIYFVILVVVGAVVILNLALTIITDAFSRSVAMEEELKERQIAILKTDREEAERAARRLAEGREELAKITQKVVEVAPERPSELTLRVLAIKARIYKAMRTQHYVYFLSFLSFVNLCLLASFHEGMSDLHRDAVDMTCRVISCIFLADGFVFAASSPVKRTLHSPTTIFRFAVGVLAVVEWFLWDSGAVSAFFAIRILQPMRRIKSLRVTFAYLYKALKASFTLIGLLFCVIFLFAIVGMQLFSGKLCGLDSSSPLQTNTSLCDGVPRTNFDNVGYGIVTVFIIVVGDGWRGIMNDSLARVSDLASIYYCLCYLIGGYLIMNLFVAVLFSQSGEAGEEEEDAAGEDDDGDDVGTNRNEESGNYSAMMSNYFVSSRSSSPFGGGDNSSMAGDGRESSGLPFDGNATGPLNEYSSTTDSRRRARSFIDSMIVDRVDTHTQHYFGANSPLRDKGRINKRSDPSPSLPLINLEDAEGNVELIDLKPNASHSAVLGAERGGNPSVRSGVTEGVTLRQKHRNRFKSPDGRTSPLLHSEGSDVPEASSILPPPLLRSSSSTLLVPPSSFGLRREVRRNRTVSVMDPLTNTISIPGVGAEREGDAEESVGVGVDEADNRPQSRRGGGGGIGRRKSFLTRGGSNASFDEFSAASSVASFSASRHWSSRTVMNSLKSRYSSNQLAAPRHHTSVGGDESNRRRRRGARRTSPLIHVEGANSSVYSFAPRPHSRVGSYNEYSSEEEGGSACSTAGEEEEEEEEEADDHDDGVLDDTWDDLGDYFTPIQRRTTSTLRRRKNTRSKRKDGGDPNADTSRTAANNSAAVTKVTATAAAAQQKVMSVMTGLEKLTAVLSLADGEQTQAETLNNKHVTILSRICKYTVTSRAFSWFMLVVILFSMVSLAMVDPLTYPDSALNQLTIWSDFICGVMFFLEFLLKLGYLGFYSRSEGVKGYFNSPWNTFDFCLMVVGLCPAVSPFYSDPQFNDAVDVLRVVRAFRPFSFVGRHNGLELIFRSFIISLPPIANISVIVLLVWFVFSIAAMQLFRGMLWACSSSLHDGDWGDKSYNYPFIKNKSECESAQYGFYWTNYVANYDHFGAAMLTMFKIAANDNWHPIMFAAVDTTGTHGEAPTAGSRPFMVCFFIAFVVLESFFLINFFISVMVDTYFLTKAKMEAAMRAQSAGGGIELLDDDQLNFVNMYRRALIFVKPPLHVSIQKGSLRYFLRRIARSRQFEFAYLLFAFIQTCLLATQHMEDPPMSFDTLLYIDLGFTIIFWLYIAVKMTVLGFSSFFEQNTRRIEVLINLLTTAGVLGELIVGGPIETLTLFRLCRVLRLYRTIYLDSEMRLLVETITMSLPSIIKVFLILMMTFYLFAVIGMSLFGRVRWKINAKDGAIGNYANFQRLDSAFMVLLRVATLDDWAELMHGCGVRPPECDLEIGDCGSSWVASIYFCLLVLILQWIGLNFFTAALMDAFNNAEKEERYAVQKKDIDTFRRKWKDMVGLDTTMSFTKVQQFIAKLDGPLGPHFDALHNAQASLAEEGETAGTQQVSAASSSPRTFFFGLFSRSSRSESDEEQMMMQRLQSRPPPPSFHRVLAFLMRLRLPVYDATHVSQSDLFDALMRFYYGVPLPRHVDAQLVAVMKRRFEVGQFERHVEAAGQTHARIPLQFVAAAAIIQTRWRGVRVRRIVNATLAEHRGMMAAEGLTMAHIQQAKRDRARQERLLARPIGVEII